MHTSKANKLYNEATQGDSRAKDSVDRKDCMMLFRFGFLVLCFVLLFLFLVLVSAVPIPARLAFDASPKSRRILPELIQISWDGQNSCFQGRENFMKQFMESIPVFVPFVSSGRLDRSLVILGIYDAGFESLIAYSFLLL